MIWSSKNGHQVKLLLPPVPGKLVALQVTLDGIAMLAGHLSNLPDTESLDLVHCDDGHKYLRGDHW